ncbi:MAG: MutS-related protein, partial [Acidimicrobiales bacterium]
MAPHLRLGPRSSYSFTIPPRDEFGAQALAELSGRGINLVANAAAQSADHVAAYFAMLRAELGFYVASLNLWEALAAKGEPRCFPVARSPSPVAFACSGLCDA